MEKHETSPPSGAATRRDFIRTTATATAALAATGIIKTPVYGADKAPAAGRAIGANDRIAVGYIGIGGPPSNCPGMGLAHVKSQKKLTADANITQAAVCDLYS